MKKKYYLYVLTLVISFVASSGYAQSNIITLTSLPGGTEGNTTFTDTSTLNVNAAGVTTYLNSTIADDWSVAATTVTASGALSKTFGIVIGGMATTNTTQGDYGNKILDGGIDRAADGAIGVRSGVSAGIDINEGIRLGLNLTNLGTSASIQITKIYVSLAGDANEIGVAVSRLNPSKRITFGNSATPGVDIGLTNGAGAIDISAFNIYLVGGLTNSDLVSVFNNSGVDNNIRITGIELRVLTNNLNTGNIVGQLHPRLLLKQGDEVLIQNLISTSPEFSKIHSYIIERADSFLTAPALVKPAANARLLAVSREAVQQIFYLSYAYRMTGELPYLTKAESVINTVCDFDSWNTYSLDTAEMCFAVAIGYDWLFNGLTAATKTNARDAILRYGFLTQKTRPFWDYTSNWNQVCIGGLTFGALAIFGDGTTQMDTESAYVLNRILVKNPNSMNTYANGNYQEGAMYWSYGTTYEVLMLSALEVIYGTNNEGINRLINSPGFLESAKYMQYVTGPTSLYFNYGDSTEKRVPLPATLWMAKKANNLSVLSEEKKLMENDRYISGFNESIFLPIAMIYGAAISMGNLPDPQEKLWKGYGDQPVVLVRTDWQGSTGKYTGIKGGTPNYSHSQMDGGTFVYDSQGLRWGMDFGKYDYDAQGTIDDNDFSQTSQRWSIFKVSNLSQNTISIKKASETNWQRHKVTGIATIDEIYDADAKRGAKANLKSLLGLNNELLAANRSVSLINESYLEVEDYISNGAEPINLYWNMVTRALVQTISPSKIRLTQGGKTVELEVVSSNPAVTFNLVTNRSTDPVFYNPTATADDKNPGTVMIGFEASIPANNNVTFTVTIKDAAVVPPSTIEPINNILLELPNPTTGLEGNSFFYDTSELHIDSNGAVSIGGIATSYAWNVYGSSNINSAKDSKIFFRWHGMGTTNTASGPDYGALITQAGIDRSSDGQLGIRSAITADTGIDLNEGYKLGLDLSFLPNTATLQLIKVGVNFVTADRKGVIVNRKDTTKRRTFGGSSAIGVDVRPPSGVGFIDVTNLNILLEGGKKDYDIASVFNTGGAGGFRITKYVFKIAANTNLNTSSFEDVEKNILTIYPNPFTESIKLNFKQNNNDTIRFQLYSIDGSRVLDKTYSVSSGEQDIVIDLKDLQSGMYIAKTIDGNEITIKKIVKR